MLIYFMLILCCIIGYILYSYANLFHAELRLAILCKDRMLNVLFCYKYLNMFRMYSLSDWNCSWDIIVTSEESHNASSITTVRYYMLHITLHMNIDDYSIMTEKCDIYKYVCINIKISKSFISNMLNNFLLKIYGNC